MAVALLLAMMALLSGGAAWRESVTVDEVAHIGAGVSYLQRLDMRMNEEHPPLPKALAAIPLVLRGVHADYSHVSWTFSNKMFNAFLGEWVFGHWLIMRWNDPYSTVLWARVPMLLITLLLGLAICVCGSRLGDTWGGLLCLCVYVSMPAFLAFGPLVITDIAVALFWILAVWLLPGEDKIENVNEQCGPKRSLGHVAPRTAPPGAQPGLIGWLLRHTAPTQAQSDGHKDKEQ